MNTKPARLLFAALVLVTTVTHVRADGQERWQVGSSEGAPSPRGYPAAIWTGREMIIWGGYNFGGALNTGERFDPIADRWTALPSNGAPSPRYAGPSSWPVVWTGSEMIIWGGGDGVTFTATGARFNTNSNTWTPISTNGAPEARGWHVAVWTGSEMLVWGGVHGTTYLATGGRYNPANDTWTAMTTNGAPSPRASLSVIWTGTEMIVWGGGDASGVVNTGGRYNPALNSWRAISTTDAPTARWTQGAVWTGTEMLVWGGRTFDNVAFNTGGRYDPVSDTWTAITTTGAPIGRWGTTPVWSGREMLVWGGDIAVGLLTDTGGRYDPTADKWTNITMNGAPSARWEHNAVWTGESMITFGGGGYSGFPTGTFLYFPPRGCEPAPQGLVAWWPGNGNANNIVSTNHGTLQNGATFAPGKVGQAFSFNGVAGYVSVSHSPSLRPVTNSFSLAAWIRTTNGIGWRNIIAQYEGSGSSFGYGYYGGAVVDGKLRFDLRDSDRGGDPTPDVGGGQKLVGTHDVADGAFHHVAFVRDVEHNEMRIYLDGTLEASAPLNAGATGTIQDDDGEDDLVIIGAARDTYLTTVGGIFDGIIDEVQHYAGALTSNEIAPIYAARGAGMCAPGVSPCSNCPPAIVTQPVSLTTFVGESASFNVTASGTTPLTYQWQKGGVVISGATNASFTIANAQLNDAGSYSVLVTNLHGSAISSNATLTVLERLDYFTGFLNHFANALAFSTLIFTPDGDAGFYAPCREVATSFPTDPAGGTLLPLGDDNFVQVTLAGTSTVGIYNRRTNVLFIGSNGYLTMDYGDAGYDASLSRHFDRPRVSALFDDLFPAAGGTVSWKQLSNLVAVTYQNVPHYDYGGANSFQIEMFFDGRIRLTYLALSARRALAGLSAGKGVPTSFLESDLSSYGPCVVRPPRITLASDGSGGFFIRFNGVAGLGYQLQRAMSVTGPWVSNATVTARAPGLIEFHDTNAPSGQAFYRALQQ